MNRRLVALLMCVLGAASWTGCAQVRALISPRAAEHTLPVSEGYVTAADGVQLFYRTVGAGADTLLVVHGGPGQHMGYLDNLEPLAAGGTLIFYDQRGSGRSSLPLAASQLTAALHVSDLEAVRRHFRLERVSLLGHSWGALLAALYAGEHPTRAEQLVLAAPPPVLDPRVAGQLLENARAPSPMDTATSPVATCRALAFQFISGMGSDSVTAERVTRGACEAHPDALRHGWTVTNRATLESLSAWDLRSRLAQVRARSLVIVGARDPLTTPEAARLWSAALPNGRLATMAAGHYVFADDPVGFATLVREFLGRN